MSLWLRRRDSRTLLYIEIEIFRYICVHFSYAFFSHFYQISTLPVTINLIQLLAVILIRINYLSIKN